MYLYTPVEKLPNVGTFYQKKLNKLGILTAEDLLFHFPYKYDDFSNLIPISEITSDANCSVKGKVKDIKTKRIFKKFTKQKSITQATIEDENKETINVVWFNQPYLEKTIKKEDDFVFSGKATIKNGETSLLNPLYQKQEKKDFLSGSIIPYYPETRGINSSRIRLIIKNILPLLKNEIKEIIPDEIIKEKNLFSVKQAIQQIHFPSSLKKATEAKKRFSFEQVFLIQLTILTEKIRLSREKSFSIEPNVELIQRFVNSLSFKLTDSQKKSAWQILKDTEKTYPMNRLLEGDVGSGKTIVAAIAILNTIKAGFQASLMAPTEILAKQHFNEVFKLIKQFNINIGLLTGKQDRFYSKKLRNDFVEISKQKLLSKIKSGEMNLLIGTHSLIQDQVKFNNLALVVLDEQHRFGVKQRAKLVNKDSCFEPKIPHLLSMTATPIPRTLALSVYGDLDISLIKEMPKERKKIITKVVAGKKEREKVYDFVKKEVGKQKQVFIICPKIEPSDKMSDEKSKWFGVKAVKEEHEKLSKEVFPEFNIGIIHGKMKTKEKEKTMLDFKNKKIDVLVSTSVVEVGIDIPNATVMIIEGAERFGLAQLHQFRGRVGRSKFQSYCFLFPESSSIKTKKRLQALVSSNDGFSLSEKDLEIRGPGDFMGARQWGVPDMIMDSLKDLSLVSESKESAKKLLEKDWTLKKHPLLKRKVQELRKKIHLE